MELKPDRREILRYLGYHGQTPDPQTDALLSQCIIKLQQAVKPRFTYRIFEVTQDLKNKRTLLPECDLVLPGHDIYRHLQGCEKCAVMAATLGIEADNLIRIAEAESMSRAVILDACATELIEKLCDYAEQEIAGLAAREEKHLNFRFSPGYGDCPLSLQKPITEILDTQRKIGLTVTEHALMLPRKSVTALLGFTRQPKHHASCATCSLQGRCQFQKEEKPCGH